MNIVKAFSNGKYVRAIAFISLLTIEACNKQAGKPTIPCGACPLYSSELAVLPGITIRIVDKTSGADLFFGSSAEYNLSQLKVSHIVNGQPDSVSTHVWVDTAAQHIFIGFYPARGSDTVTVQIANLSQDNLIFKSGTVGACCPMLKINSVFFDGTEVYTAANGPNVVILAK